MSLGFSNIAFPDMAELDKMADFDQANYHYSNAPTASSATAVSYTNAQPSVGSGNYCTAMAKNGNWLSIYEGKNNFSITEGVGGTQTNYTNQSSLSSSWRGVVYAPNANKFVVIGSLISFVNADTGANTNISNPLNSQSWGGIYVDGLIYIYPYTSSSTYIGVIDPIGLTATTFATIPSSNNGLAGALDKDGVMVWGTEGGDTKLRMYDLITDTYSTLSSQQYGGYNGWAVLGDGRLWTVSFNNSTCEVYTPASMNSGVAKVDTYSKNGMVNLGPWGMSFTGLDGNGYYLDSKGKSQNGGIYHDIYGFDYKTNIWFMTQFKLPGPTTSGDRSYTNAMVLPDGRLLMPGDRFATDYYTLQMFEPLNTITQARQVSGFIPDTSN